jgi:hypothetical protein
VAARREARADDWRTPGLYKLASCKRELRRDVTDRSFGPCFDRGWWRGWSTVACLKMSGPASACQVDALTTVSFEAHRLPLSILLWHPSPTMMIDLTAAGKPPLTPFWGTPSRRTASRHRRQSATPKPIIANLEPPPAAPPRCRMAGLTSGKGASPSDDPPRLDRIHLQTRRSSRRYPVQILTTTIRLIAGRDVWAVSGQAATG